MVRFPHYFRSSARFRLMFGWDLSVVLWHHRTAHMAGQNYSKGIRQAALYDYIKKPEFYDDGPPPADMYDQHRQICHFRRL